VTFEDPFFNVTPVALIEGLAEVTIGDLLLALDLAESKGDVMRTAKQNGFRINGKTIGVNDLPRNLTINDLLGWGEISDEKVIGVKIGRGKTPRFIIRMVPQEGS
jgi:hypothetical protein